MTIAQHSLYRRHLQQRRTEVDQALNELGYDAVLIHSGRPKDRLFDDQHPPFRTHAPFVAMLPLPFAVDCLLELRVGERPRLWFFQPRDFWHLPPSDPEAWWADEFEIVTVASASAWASRFISARALAAIGEPELLSGLGDGVAINPPALIHRLAEHRTQKTPWEQQCLQQANRIGACAHLAAAAAFRDGFSEHEIHLAYLKAACQDQDHLPYSSIVALNEHAAVLHYQNRETIKPSRSSSFLLDAGANRYGYGSDITRSWAREGSEVFAALISEMDALQQRLCGAVRTGVSFVDLHLQAHRGVAHILHQAGIVGMSADDMVDAGVSRYFFPHGLGHFLGVQVHDVNGQVDSFGEALPPPEVFPALRLTRDLAEGNVVTVEPGLYFIPMLLEELKASRYGECVDWTAVSHLMPYGGIRIEDNVVVTAGEPVNLTRQAFAEAA